MRKLVTLSLLFAAAPLISAILLSTTTSGHKDKFYSLPEPIPGQYIVVLNDDYVGRAASAPEVEAEAQYLSSMYGGEVRNVYSNALKGYSVSMSSQEAESLSKDDRVLSVEEDAWIYPSTSQTNAPWNLDRVDQRNLPLNTTFDYEQDGTGAHIYILDTGIRITHEDFGGRASVAFDALGDGQNGLDCSGHGTHVAGLAAGATYGVAKNAFVHSVRVLPCSGGGQIAHLIMAVDWLTANRVNPAVANISITAAGISPAMETAISNSIASGITYTIAAGNSFGEACNFTPARTPNAITVGATSVDDIRPSYSNYGACLDLFAPGQSILSAGLASDSAVVSKSGTSMAAPHVAGVAAVYRAANPSANPAAVALAINNSVTSGVVTSLGAGSPNKLLYSWLGGGPPSTPTPTPTPTVTPTPTPTPTPSLNGHVSVRKRVIRSGGTSSVVVFPYQAPALASPSFTLLDNQEFSDPTVPAGAQVIAVTEANVAGMRLTGVECVEAGGQTVPNTTVDVANRRANIVVESGESVTCTFTSEELAPTAGHALVSGRVVDASGRGVRAVELTLLNAITGETRRATTNAFGLYFFDDLEVATFYVLTAQQSKRFSLENNVRSFTLNDNLVDVDFLAEPVH